MRSSRFVGAVVLFAAACGGRVVVDAQGTGAGGAATSSSTTSSSSSSTTASSSTTTSSSSSSTTTSSSSTTTSSSSSSGAGGGLAQLAELVHPYALALDADYVYVTSYDPGAVLKVPKNGGQPVVLAYISGASFMGVDDSNVYFSASDGALYLLPKQGGTAKQLLGSPGDVCSIATDAGHVYCAQLVAGTITAFDTTSFAPTALGPAGQLPRGLSSDAVNLYWGADTAGSVSKMPKTGGPAVAVAKQATEVWSTAVDATRVYWGETGAIKSVAKDGGPVTVLADDGGSPTIAVAVDDQYVYWTNNATQRVSAVTKGGGPAKVIATGQGDMRSIAADASGVYWVSLDGGQLMRFTW